jgi:hypothetical protein
VIAETLDSGNCDAARWPSAAKRRTDRRFFDGHGPSAYNSGGPVGGWNYLHFGMF